MKKYAPLVLRLGMSLVFIWFGSSQLMNPDAWTVWLPPSLSSLPIGAMNLILLNGTFELIAAILLLLGVYVRPVALLLALHMIGITSMVGYNDVGVRDFGLLASCLAVSLQGPDMWCLVGKDQA